MKNILFKGNDVTSIGDSNPLPVEVRGYSFSNIVTATTTAVKASAGCLHTVVINEPVANGVIEVYNNTSAAAPLVGTVTFPATLLSDGPHTLVFDVECGTGITVKTTGTMDITVAYL